MGFWGFGVNGALNKLICFSADVDQLERERELMAFGDSGDSVDCLIPEAR